MTTSTTVGRRPGHVAVEKLALGLVLIVLGLLLALEQAGFLAPGGLHTWWPLFLIGLGLARLLSPGQSGGLMMFGLGVLFLLQTCHLAPLRQTWPLMLVLAGISMVVHRRRPGGRACAHRRVGGES